MVTVTKDIASNALDAFRDDHSLEFTITEASISDDLQLGIRLKCNLAQLFATTKRAFSEFFDGVRNEYLFYVAPAEPFCSHDLEPFREAQHLRVFLVETKLFSRHRYVWGNVKIGDSSSQQTEPAEFLDALVQLELPQITTLFEGQGLNLSK